MSDWTTSNVYRVALATAISLVVLAVVLALTYGHSTSGEAEAADNSGVNFSMSIAGCAEGAVNTKGGDAKCSLASGETFTVNFNFDALDALPDTDSDGIHGYTHLSMTATFAGVQYQTGTFVELHGVSSPFPPTEPPLGDLVPNGINDFVEFGVAPCTPPDVDVGFGCESVAKGLTVWTAEFKCGNTGFVQLETLIQTSTSGDEEGTLLQDDDANVHSEANPERITVNCPGAPVGGIALDADLQPLPLGTTNSGSSRWSAAIGFVVAVAIVAAGGAIWFSRRRSAS